MDRSSAPLARPYDVVMETSGTAIWTGAHAKREAYFVPSNVLLGLRARKAVSTAAG